MSFNILDAVKSHLTPDLISKASSFLGESEGGITKAISGILPVVLSGMVSKANDSTSGAKEIFNSAKETNSSGFLGGIGNIFSDGGGMLNKGADLLKGLFGDKLSSIIDTITSFAGIKKSSVSSILSMAAPVAAGTLGKHAADNNIDADGLSLLLKNQKSSISNLLPAGLGSITSLFGIGKVSDAISSVANSGTDKVKAMYNRGENTVRKSGSFGWLPWVLLLLAAGLLASWFLFGGKSNCKSTASADNSDSTTQISNTTEVNNNGETNTVNLTIPTVSIDSLTGLVSYDLGNEVEFSLPDGAKFIAAERGFESQLLGFIKDGTINEEDKSANWFNMFDVQFKTGSNDYTGKAESQLANCAAILKAYPAVKIKLGGYTDNTGSADANTRISQQRSDRVKADLMSKGVTADQIVESIGYGPQFPVCEQNDTKECQARNRRVACKVAVK